MLATIKRIQRGTAQFPAMPDDEVTMPIPLAKAALNYAEDGTGFWRNSIRRAVRFANAAGYETVTVRTSGYGTDHLTDAIRSAGGTVEWANN